MRQSLDVKKLTLTSIFMAMVIVLHALSFIIKVGIFQFQLSLVAIIIGSILLGCKSGGALGLVSALFILLCGDATLFLIWNPFFTILIVITKGVCSGIVPGLVYNLLKNKTNENINVIVSSLTAPLVNTGIFALGCILFFIPNIKETFDAGISFVFTGFIGVNFFIEFTLVTILSPAIIRIKDIVLKQKDNQ